MSEKEIKDLAFEICKAKEKEIGDKPILLLYVDIYVDALRTISERYCLIEKSEAENLARLTFENGSSEDFGLIDGLVDWVEDNFTEEYHKVLENGSECR